MILAVIRGHRGFDAFPGNHCAVVGEHHCRSDAGHDWIIGFLGS